MSYYGRSADNINNVIKLDNITFNGGTTYALTQNGVAFVPNNSSSLLISIDGVVQQGNFTVNSSNIVFNFSPTSSNTCNWILHIGVGVAYVPAASSITKDKTDFVSTSSSAGLTIKGDGTTDGYIGLSCSQNSHAVKIKAPSHSSSQSYTLTLPGTAPAANKIIQTDGSGNLSFIDKPTATGLTHITTVSGTSSVSSVLINDCFSSTYKTYKLFGTVLVDTDDTKLEMQYTKSSGSTVGTAGYKYLLHAEQIDGSSSISDASNGNSSDTGGVELVYAIDTDATYSPVQFEMTFYDPGQHFASYQYFNGMFTYYKSTGKFVQGTIGGQYRENFNATGLKFKTDSNNFSRYYFNVYGITNSGS